MASSEDSKPAPLSSHLLGKYFAWRGRKSTGFCYSILSPNDQPWKPSKGKDAEEDNSQSEESEKEGYGNEDNFSDFMRIYPETLNKNKEEGDSPPLEAEDCVIGRKGGHVPTQRHFKVHGKDAYENALKSLGNVNTLFNRYGYDDKTKNNE